MGLEFLSCGCDNFLEEIMQVMVSTVKMTDDVQDGIVDFAPDIAQIIVIDHFICDQVFNSANDILEHIFNIQNESSTLFHSFNIGHHIMQELGSSLGGHVHSLGHVEGSLTEVFIHLLGKGGFGD